MKKCVQRHTLEAARKRNKRSDRVGANRRKVEEPSLSRFPRRTSPWKHNLFSIQSYSKREGREKIALSDLFAIQSQEFFCLSTFFFDAMQSTPSIWRCLLHVSKVTNIKCCSSTQLFLYIDTTIGSFSKQVSFTLFPSFSCINSRCCVFILNKRFKKEKHVYCIINTGRGFAAKWRSQHAKSGASRFPLRQIPVAMAPCFPKAAAPHRRRR